MHLTSLQCSGKNSFFRLHLLVARGNLSCICAVCDAFAKPDLKVTGVSGNSLGLQPKMLKSAVDSQLDKWASQGVEGHFQKPTPWLAIDDIVVESTAKLVGAQPNEVVIMNSLTANLHFMMASFYCPTKQRFKIITEKKAFPSDTHAIYSQIVHHGFNPSDALIEIRPRDGEDTLRLEDITQVP
jgi:kynureninase